MARGARAALLLLVGLAASSCCAAMRLGARPSIVGSRVRTPMHCGPADGERTPEELLLEAVGFLKGNQIELARTNVAMARRICEDNGGATVEQGQLLELVSSRLPPPAAKAAEPTLAEMFPGTTAAPTGESLKLPGTPSMAELAAKAREKREAQSARDETPKEE